MADSPAPRRRPSDDARRPGRRADERRPANHRARSHRANGGAQQWRVQVDPDRAANRGGRRHRREANAATATTAGTAPAAAVSRRRTGGASHAAETGGGTSRSGLLMLVAGLAVLMLGVGVAIVGNGAVETEEVLTAEETTTDVTPEPLAAEVRGEMIQRHLRGVPVPFPRNVEIHDVVAATEPMTEADVIDTVNATLHDWNLTPDGALVHNPCPPHARACVDVDNRLAWLQENGAITTGPVPTTTGKPGYETPRGEFTVQRKVRDEISYVFENEPMPFSVYFTTTGVAFREGDLTEDSHGCIHLSNPDAMHFFDVLESNDIVVTL